MQLPEQEQAIHLLAIDCERDSYFSPLWFVWRLHRRCARWIHNRTVAIPAATPLKATRRSIHLALEPPTQPSATRPCETIPAAALTPPWAGKLFSPIRLVDSTPRWATPRSRSTLATTTPRNLLPINPSRFGRHRTNDLRRTPKRE